MDDWTAPAEAPAASVPDATEVPWYLRRAAVAPSDAKLDETAEVAFDTVLEYRGRWLAAARAEADLPTYAQAQAAVARGDRLLRADAERIDRGVPLSNVLSLRVQAEDWASHTTALKSLLRAWCAHAPGGYTKEMNVLAAVCLAVCGHDEADAFALFALLLRRLPPELHVSSPPLRGFQVELSALMRLLGERLPQDTIVEQRSLL